MNNHIKYLDEKLKRLADQNYVKTMKERSVDPELDDIWKKVEAK